MSAQQLQYYSFLERERKRAMYRESLTYYYIHTIKNQLINGMIPTENPDLSAQFWYLIDEYGVSLFADELSAFNLVYEDDTLKKIEHKS